MSLLRKSFGKVCIYKIQHKDTGLFYIGQTSNLQRRHQYPSNYKNCTKLYEDIVKYGWDAFEKTVVEECMIGNLDEKELYYINTLKPHYNLRGGEDDIYKVAEISKERMSKSKKEDDRIERKKVICVETGEVFNSIQDAAAHVGATKISISRTCRGIYKSTKGYTWKFLDEVAE